MGLSKLGLSSETLSQNKRKGGKGEVSREGKEVKKGMISPIPIFLIKL